MLAGTVFIVDVESRGFISCNAETDIANRYRHRGSESDLKF